MYKLVDGEWISDIDSTTRNLLNIEKIIVDVKCCALHINISEMLTDLFNLRYYFVCGWLQQFEHRVGGEL